MTPNLTPEPHDPQNLSRPRQDAHDGEKISGIPCIAFHKIGVKKISLAPPSGEIGSGRGLMTSSLGRGLGDYIV